MELVANLMSTDVDPVAWGRQREAEGWEVLAVADHLFTSHRPYPHLWVTATAIAVATERVRVASTFANNLFRHPVEFAQASLALQQVSAGRFDAGLGAGWSRAELEQTGRPFPSAGERVERYVEALHIVRALFAEGHCHHDGRWYQVDANTIGPRTGAPPPLMGALGGPRMIREAAPLLDLIELKAASTATRDGTLDMDALGQVPPSRLTELVDAVREHNHDARLSLFALCAVGTDERTQQLADSMPDGSLYGGFFGEPAKVLHHLQELESYGITRATVSPFNDGAFELLAEERRRRA